MRVCFGLEIRRRMCIDTYSIFLCVSKSYPHANQKSNFILTDTQSWYWSVSHFSKIWAWSAWSTSQARSNLMTERVWWVNIWYMYPWDQRRDGTWCDDWSDAIMILLSGMESGRRPYNACAYILSCLQYYLMRAAYRRSQDLWSQADIKSGVWSLWFSPIDTVFCQ